MSNKFHKRVEVKKCPLFGYKLKALYLWAYYSKNTIFENIPNIETFQTRRRVANTQA